jgi:sugar phosphate isomerase/epimerase
MWTITGFADEVGPDVEEQLRCLTALGVRHLELRSAWQTNVLRLDAEQLDTIEAALAHHGVAVSSIGSPVGKIRITDPFEPHLEKMRHACRLAERFGARYVRVFSFFAPPGESTEEMAIRHRDEVLNRMRAIAAVAAQHGVTALHENEKDIYGDVPGRCADVVTAVDSANLRHILDPANYVQCGVRPVDDAYPLVRDRLEYLHIKDAHVGSGEVVAAGDGDGQLRELIRVLRADGFEGFCSIEPHLGSFDAFGGQCGPELWGVAHAAFTRLLHEEGIEYA